MLSKLLGELGADRAAERLRELSSPDLPSAGGVAPHSGAEHRSCKLFHDKHLRHGMM